MATAAETETVAAADAGVRAENLMTAEAFAARPDPGYPEELVEGGVTVMSPPGARHGQICNRAGRVLGDFAEGQSLGHVLNNDSGVVTRRGPDSVRGADLAYYPFDRLPRGPVPEGYPGVPPELVVEVRSPSDRWSAVLAKVAEYLGAGVAVVCVLDDATRTARVFGAGGEISVVGGDEALAFPAGVLPGFSAPVARFFG